MRTGMFFHVQERETNETFVIFLSPHHHCRQSKCNQVLRKWERNRRHRDDSTVMVQRWYSDSTVMLQWRYGHSTVAIPSLSFLSPSLCHRCAITVPSPGTIKCTFTHCLGLEAQQPLAAPETAVSVNPLGTEIEVQTWTDGDISFSEEIPLPQTGTQC